MSTAQTSAVEFYLGKGLSKDVAVGIVAVLTAESSMNPTAENNSGTETGGVINPSGSYGLAQWNGPRQAALQAFATAKGLSVSAADTQLAFVLTEAANSYPQVWAAIQAGSPGGAGITYQTFIPTFVQSYENPADPTAEINAALTYAAALYGQTYTTTPPAATTPAPAPTTTTGASALDPVITDIITALAPIFESMVGSLITTLLNELTTPVTEPTASATAPVTTPAPAAPAIDLESLASSLATVLLPQISTLVQGEIAKALPTTTTPKATS